MLSQELTLFEIQENKLQTKSTTSTVKRPELSHKQYASLDNAFSAIFPTKDESQTQKLRKNLGSIASELSDEQIMEISSKFQYLIDSWLDEFERDTFKGKTLNEVLGGK